MIADKGIADIGIVFRGLVERGLSGFGSGVLLPPDRDELIQWLVDYDSGFDYVDNIDPLRVSKPIDVGVPVLSFTGFQEIKFPQVNLVGDFTVSAIIKLVQDGSVNHWLFSSVDGKGALFPRSGTNAFGVRIASNIYKDLSSDSSILYDGDFHNLVINREGANVYFTVDGNLLATVVATSEDIPISQMFHQGTSTDLTMEGLLAHAEITSSTVFSCTEQLPLDVYGNGNHATSSTATLTTADNVPNHLGRYGYTYDNGYAPFNGVDDYIEDTEVSDTYVQSFSVCGEISTFETENTIIIECGNNNSKWTVQMDATAGKLSAFSYGTIGRIKSSSVINDGNPHGFVYTTQTDGVTRNDYLYIDESLVYSSLNRPAGNIDYSSAPSITIGARLGNLAATDMDARRFAFYDRVLSETEARSWIIGNEPEGFLRRYIPTDSNAIFEEVSETDLSNIGTGDISAVDAGYFPALTTLTDGAATITDPLNDYLAVTGLTGSEVITIDNDGGTVPVAVANGIKATNAGQWSGKIYVDGVEYTDLADIEGKTSTTITSVHPTLPDGTWNTGTAGLEDGIYKARVESASGIRVDARDYLPIGVRGSIDGALEHNGNPAGLRQTDGKVVDLIEVTGTGTVADGFYYITGTYLGETEYSHVTESYILTFNGTGWGIFGTEVWESQASATRVPPKVWDNVGSSGSPAPTLEYGYQGSFWVNDDGTFKDVYFSDYVAHPSGLYNLFLKSGPDTVGTLGQCVLREHGQYSLAHVFDASALPKLNKYWSVCGGWAPPVQQLPDTYYAIDKLGSYATDSQGDYFITIQ